MSERQGLLDGNLGTFLGILLVVALALPSFFSKRIRGLNKGDEYHTHCDHD